MARIANRVSNEISQKYTVDREKNTFVREQKPNLLDRIEVEIGDSKQPDSFYPQAKIKRWHNEVNASFRYVDKEAGEAQIRTEGNVIKYIKPKVEFHAYDLDAGDVGEDGGLELELILKEKPDENTFDFTIQTKELNFYYQPALTPEEIEQGAERPIDVEGSYAVYHASKGGMNRADGMEYKTGKAFHIYRPFAHDAEGNGVYGDLSLDEEKGVLTVTIDQKFLDTAVYPVVVDPTFGYTSVGAGRFYLANRVNATSYISARHGRVYSGVAGTLDSISINLHNQTESDTIDYYVTINTKDSGGTGTHGQVAMIERTGLSLTTTKTWYTFTASGESLSAIDYILNATGDSADLGNDRKSHVAYDVGSSGTNYEEYFSANSNAYTTSKENPWVASSSSSTTIASIYATYTVEYDGITDGLVRYYSFNDGSGSTVTDSTGNADGTFTDPNWTSSGKLDDAGVFDSSSYVTVADHADLDMSGQVSVQAWVYMTTVNVNNQLVSKRGSWGADTIPFELTSTGSPSCYFSWRVKGNGEILTDTSTAISSNTWYHVVGTWDGVTQKLYINGSEVASRTFVGSITANSTDVAIGRLPGGGENVDGRIDEVGIWNRALTSAEVTALYNSGNGFAYPFSSSTNVEVTPGVQSLTVSLPNPTITAEQNVSVSPSAQTLTTSLPSPTITTTQNVTVSPNAQSLAVSLPSPTATAVQNVSVSAGVQTLTTSLPASNVFTSGLNTHSLDLEASSSQYVYITDANQTGLDITGDLSIEAWLKIESLPSGEYILAGKGDSGDTAYLFAYNITNSQLRLYLTSTGGSSTSSVSWTPSTGVWYHVAVTYDASAGEVKFFVNGSQQGSTQTGAQTSIRNSGARFYVGAWNLGSNSYDGKIDDVRVWDDLRTPTEIADNRGIVLAGNEANLVGYWRFDDDLIDQTSNNNDLTAANSPVFTTDNPFDTVVSAGVQTLTVSLPTPTVSTTQNVSTAVAVQTLTVSTPSPTVTTIQNATVSPSVQSLSVSLPSPTISTDSNVEVSAGVQTLTVSLPAPIITADGQDAIITPNVQTLTLSQNAPDVSAIQNTTITPSVLSLSTEMPSHTVTAIQNVSFTPDVMELFLTLSSASVSTIRNVEIAPDVQEITISLISPLIRAFGYVNKYNPQGTIYGDYKYVPQGDTYTDKY